jgi:hypothetical protein
MWRSAGAQKRMHDLFPVVIESLRLRFNFFERIVVIFSVFERIRLVDDEKRAISILRDMRAEPSQPFKGGRFIRCRKDFFFFFCLFILA